MDQLIILVFAVVNAIALLTLVSLGLAVVFGMMQVINFAHGEFIMLGGYSAVVSYHAGVNLWISILVVAPFTVGLIGAIVEWLIIRRLYGRLVSTMLATWGLSLFLIGAVTSLFGNTMMGVSAPLGNVAVGAYSISQYQLVTVAITAAVVFLCLFVLKRTRYGLIARAAMQSPEMASAVGVDPARVYAVTFSIGAALSGLAGGLLAPISGVIPHMGAAYVARAFVTVISGGSAMILGPLAATGILGPIEAILSYVATPVIGQAALLIVAIVILRILPKGLSSLWNGAR